MSARPSFTVEYLEPAVVEAEPLPDEFSASRLRRSLVLLAAVVLAVTAVLVLVPGLSSLREKFMGAQPEAFVRAFLDRLIPNPSEIEHRAAREALAKGQAELAESYLKNAIALDPSNDGARLDMAALLLDRGDVAAARTHFDSLSGHAKELSTYSTVSSRLEASELAQALPPVETLRRRIRVNPEDLDARMELAELHISRGEYSPALDELLEVVRRDRNFRDDSARLKMLAVFEMAAGHPDLVTDYRSKLSSLLF